MDNVAHFNQQQWWLVVAESEKLLANWFCSQLFVNNRSEKEDIADVLALEVKSVYFPNFCVRTSLLHKIIMHGGNPRSRAPWTSNQSYKTYLPHKFQQNNFRLLTYHLQNV